jgi:hypothetical protein
MMRGAAWHSKSTVSSWRALNFMQLIDENWNFKSATISNPYFTQQGANQVINMDQKHVLTLREE